MNYTITVRNIATTPVQDLQITQTIPGGLRLISAGDDGTSSAGSVTWSVELVAGASRTLPHVGHGAVDVFVVRRSRSHPEQPSQP